VCVVCVCVCVCVPLLYVCISIHTHTHTHTHIARDLHNRAFAHGHTGAILLPAAVNRDGAVVHPGIGGAQGKAARVDSRVLAEILKIQ
jgi:hypothetical protein